MPRSSPSPSTQTCACGPERHSNRSWTLSGRRSKSREESMPISPPSRLRWMRSARRTPVPTARTSRLPRVPSFEISVGPSAIPVAKASSSMSMISGKRESQRRVPCCGRPQRLFGTLDAVVVGKMAQELNAVALVLKREGSARSRRLRRGAARRGRCGKRGPGRSGGRRRP